MKSVVVAFFMGIGLIAVMFIQREAKKKAYAERLRAAGQAEERQDASIPEIPSLEFESIEDAREAYEIVLKEQGVSGQPVHWEIGHDHTRCLRIQDFHKSRDEIQATYLEIVAGINR